MVLRALIVPLTKTRADVAAWAGPPSSLVWEIEMLAAAVGRHCPVFCQRIIGINVGLDTILPGEIHPGFTQWF